MLKSHMLATKYVEILANFIARETHGWCGTIHLHKQLIALELQFLMKSTYQCHTI